MVGSLELFYTKAPDAMRSTCAAVQLLATGIGSYLAAALVAIVQAASTSGGSPGWLADNINQGHMDYYFWCAECFCWKAICWKALRAAAALALACLPGATPRL